MLDLLVVVVGMMLMMDRWSSCNSRMDDGVRTMGNSDRGWLEGSTAEVVGVGCSMSNNMSNNIYG